MPLKGLPLDEPGINLTSMLDVVMLLIMFFMAGTQFKDEEKDYDIQLPTGHDTVAISDLPDEIIINVRADGVLTIRQQAYSLEQLDLYLREVSSRYPNQAVVIRGDAQVPYDAIMKVITTSRLAGIRSLSLAYREGKNP